MLSSSAGQTMYRYIKIPSLESLTSVSKSFELNCLGVSADMTTDKLALSLVLPIALLQWLCLPREWPSEHT